MTTDPLEAAAAAARLRASRAAIDTVREVHRQQIRDAHTDGMPATEIAAALGVKNRVTVTAALDSPPVDPVDPPTLPPVVFLRGAGADPQRWQAIAAAIHRRGYVTVRDRTQAWHLARGRVPVTLVDFSTSLAGQIRIGRVAAKTPTTGTQEQPADPGRRRTDRRRRRSGHRRPHRRPPLRRAPRSRIERSCPAMRNATQDLWLRQRSGHRHRRRARHPARHNDLDGRSGLEAGALPRSGAVGAQPVFRAGRRPRERRPARCAGLRPDRYSRRP